ncbi:MAG TPA: adenosylcobinamide-phosphate synthase CbiB [Methylophilaceae bacterium]|nr:adenosylcobinamide-phosphate synthase CbiB [Methylophilaceae bacterium]
MPFDHYLITSCLTAPFVLMGALALDRVLGEPARWHPLVGFGWLASHLEKRLNRVGRPLLARILGLLAWLLLLTPFVLLAYFASRIQYGWLADLILLYFAIGARSLTQHAYVVHERLTQGNLPQARQAVGMIVSRDTAHLDEAGVASATVESVLENGNDAIFGAIFWFLIAGGAGAVLFRLANTLDAMWGYRTPRFLYFGWAAARLDDLLNLVPARLTALSYALCGHTAKALKCWQAQASTWYSPNAGPVMAAGGGALNVKLGGAANYHGQFKQRPNLGIGDAVTVGHILAAVNLVQRSIMLWCGIVFLGAVAAAIAGACRLA